MHVDRIRVQSTFVYVYAGLRVLMIWANCFFLLRCLFFEKSRRCNDNQQITVSHLGEHKRLHLKSSKQNYYIISCITNNKINLHSSCCVSELAGIPRVTGRVLSQRGVSSAQARAPPIIRARVGAQVREEKAGEDEESQKQGVFLGLHSAGRLLTVSILEGTLSPQNCFL